MSVTALEKAGFPPIVLPKPGDVQQGTRDGRNVYEGYQRGVPLLHGKLKDDLAAHPLFRAAIKAASGRTVMMGDRLRNLFLILTLFFDRLDSRNCVEFGSYKGGSVLFMATVLAKLYPEAKVYSFDTFEGMPATDSQLDLHRKGQFADTSLDDIKAAAAALGLDNIVYCKGLVQDTFPADLPTDAKFGLAHIDLDIYHAIRHCQDNMWDRLVPGAYIVYDDATVPTCIGATQAVEELIHERNMRSEQIYPHFVFRAALS